LIENQDPLILDQDRRPDEVPSWQTSEHCAAAPCLRPPRFSGTPGWNKRRFLPFAAGGAEKIL
jgi:hypothetical protein